MHDGNPNLRGNGEQIEYSEQMIQEYIRCKEDIFHFAETYFKIISIDEGERTIELREYQKKILKTITNPDKRFFAVLSGRQIGKSTISTIYLLHTLLFNADQTIAIATNKEPTSMEILKRVAFAYQNLPLFLQAGIITFNKKQIECDNNSRIIISSTTSSSLTGHSISLLYLDEFSKIPENMARDFQDSVFPTIYSAKKSRILIVSTPKGMNHWYNIWCGAVDNTNGFVPIKINWREIPGRDEKFKSDIIQKYGLLHWRQEYAAVFIGTSQTLIDPDVLEQHRPKEPIEYRYGYSLKIYELPKKGCLYAIGVDVSQGVGADNSAMQILKINSKNSIEQVATYTSNDISVDNFAERCIEVSKLYNEAILVIENNGFGAIVITRIWWGFEYENVFCPSSKEIGFSAQKATKFNGNVALRRYFDNRWISISDTETIFELSRYEEVKDNIFKAAGGAKDDRVMSLLWVVYYVESYFDDGRDINFKINDKNKLDITESDEIGVDPFLIDDGRPDLDTSERELSDWLRYL